MGKYLVMQAWDTTEDSEVDRFAVALDRIPVSKLAAQAAMVRMLFDDETRPACALHIDWCEGDWFLRDLRDELDGPILADELTDDSPKGAVESGHIELWWECGRAMIEFHAHVKTGIEYYSAAVALDWLAERLGETAPESIPQSKCDNCGSIWNNAAFILPIPNLAERLEPGGVVPSGECPECGALCYPVKEPPTKQEWMDELHDKLTDLREFTLGDESIRESIPAGWSESERTELRLIDAFIDIASAKAGKLARGEA